MSYRLYLDSNNGVSLDPHWDFSYGFKKNEQSHRTQGGKLFKYKYSHYEAWKFKVDFISSADAAIINSWHVSNTLLLFKNESATAIFSVLLTGRKTPMSKLVKPYDDEYKGTIELETY